MTSLVNCLKNLMVLINNYFHRICLKIGLICPKQAQVIVHHKLQLFNTDGTEAPRFSIRIFLVQKLKTCSYSESITFILWHCYYIYSVVVVLLHLICSGVITCTFFCSGAFIFSVVVLFLFFKWCYYIYSVMVLLLSSVVVLLHLFCGVVITFNLW